MWRLTGGPRTPTMNHTVVRTEEEVLTVPEDGGTGEDGEITVERAEEGFFLDGTRRSGDRNRGITRS